MVNFDQYKGRYVEIKSTQKLAQVQDVRVKHGLSGVQSARFIVVDEDQKPHELQPHELIFLQTPTPDTFDGMARAV